MCIISSERKQDIPDHLQIHEREIVPSAGAFEASFFVSESQGPLHGPAMSCLLAQTSCTFEVCFCCGLRAHFMSS